MSKPATLGGYHFKTQEELKVFCQRLLKEQYMVRIDETHELFPFLCELAMRHHEYEQKAGCGIAAFNYNKIIINN